MKLLRRAWIVAMPVAALPLWSCQQGQSPEAPTPPARVERMEGGGVSRVVLTNEAARRLDIRTTAVMGIGGRDQVTASVPYAAVLYDTEGRTWVYTAPQPLTYVRRPIMITSIEGDAAYLNEGPPPGTEVVSVGAAELFSTETEEVR